MRFLYSVLLYLGTPFILLHFAIRGLKDRRYLQRWKERFGFYGAPRRPGGIVIHAASVGELNAAEPLIRALQNRQDGLPLTVTTFTPTGSARAGSLLGDKVTHVYAPLDLPGAVKRFFRFSSPQLLIVMETEIWPNLYARASALGVPLVLANARLTARSVKSYQRFSSLLANTLATVSHIAAQSEADAGRLVGCGAVKEKVSVAGNLKFDMSLPAGLEKKATALRGQWGADRPVLIAGSTHSEDDQVVFEAFGLLRSRVSGLLLIVVPRHPERFDAVAARASELGFRTGRYSDGAACSADTDCFVIDTMGALMIYYACCDVAIIGGSFGPTGGHNALEAAALGKPVIVGPNTANFADITASLIESGAAARVEDAVSLAEQAGTLLMDDQRREAMGQAGRQLVVQGQGALQHTLARVDELLVQTRSG